MRDLPTGTVTFLFTDIEGSTRLLQRLGDRYREVIDGHGRILRAAIVEGGGGEVRTEGDSFFSVFPTPAGALTAAVQAQRSLAAQSWPDDQSVRVRMGLHTGEGVLAGEDFIGLDVHLAARIAAAGHGGQVLISDATLKLLQGNLPDGVVARDLGRHRLKDIERPEHLHDLVIEGLPAEFPAIRTLDARPTNLPSPRTSFVGREREISDVTSLLAETRLLTLTGPGGTGKTRLALKVASYHIERFAQGVFFADLSPLVDPALVPSAIARALVVRTEAGRDHVDILVDHLRDKQVLLVLDNSEQVIEAAATVARLLDEAPRLTVLATSRVPFHISGEREYEVPPLSVPDPDERADAEAIAQNEAVTLFVERAAALRPGFRVTTENAATVAQITARLDGLPLAIELAASRLNVLGPKDLLARLDQRLSLLTGGARDVPERQRTLRGTIEWSHDLLAPEERHLLARLAVFSGGWTLDAAELVCGPDVELDVLDALASLVDHSLVRRLEAPHGEVRFTMLDTIREFTTERLAASGEEAGVRGRHLRYMRDLAEEAESGLGGERQAVWLERLEQEHDNLRAALDWTVRTGDAPNGLRAAAAIWRFWQLRGHLPEARRWMERLLSLPGAEARGAVRARALGALGSIAYWQNEYETMRSAYEEAVDIAREIGDPALLAVSLLNLSYVPSLEGDFAGMEAILKEAQAAASEAGHPPETADIWTSLGFLELWQGNPAGALEPVRTAIDMLRASGDRIQVADHLSGLGAIMRLLGDTTGAREHFRDVLETYVETKSTVNIPHVLNAFAMLAIDEGEHERAARLLGAAARIREESGGGAPPELMARLGDPYADARKALGEDAFERAHEEGYAMTTEQGVSYALQDDTEQSMER